MVLEPHLYVRLPKVA